MPGVIEEILMPEQLTIFDVINHQPTGPELRDEGMERSSSHAENVTPGWSDVAFSFLQTYLQDRPAGHTFMIEEVRQASERFGKVPEPPSKTAWGSVAVRAKRQGLIRWKGYGKVENPLAHSTPASIWESLL